MRNAWRLLLLAGALATLPAGPGCRRTPKVDWDARVGAFTYDDAVRELGPADKLATLSDGARVGDWLRYRGFPGRAVYYGPRFGHYGPYYGGGPGYVETFPPTPDSFLRLSFGPDGRLTEWNRVNR